MTLLLIKMVLEEAVAAVVIKMPKTALMNTPMPKTVLMVMMTPMVMVMVILKQRLPFPPEICVLFSAGSGVLWVLVNDMI